MAKHSAFVAYKQLGSGLVPVMRTTGKAGGKVVRDEVYASVS